MGDTVGDATADAVSVADVSTLAEGSSAAGLGTGDPTEPDDDEPEQAETTTTSIVARTAITNFRKDMRT